MESERRLIIVGSGPAAWTAAIYAARALLSPIVLAGEQSGGQLMLTTEVENFPGFEKSILGPQLIEAMRNQAKRLEVEIRDNSATNLELSNNIFSITYGSSSSDVGKVLRTKAVINATGAVANTLKIPGENQLMGRGVGTCAVCDAPFYKGRDTVFVIGGGDSAMEEALELSKYASKVIILVRSDKFRASAILVQRVEQQKNIEVWYRSQVHELLGETKLEHIKVTHDNKTTTIPADGLFYAIGHTPATAWLKSSGVKLDEKGYIITPLSTVISPSERANKAVKQPVSETMRGAVVSTMTSIPGVFAAGDCVDPRYRQAITAAGFGCMAALDAQKWLEIQNPT